MTNVIDLMNESFAPMAMITGVALLILGVNERYSAVMTRIRDLHREMILKQIEKSYILNSYKIQIGALIFVAKILRAALFSMYSSVFLAIISSIVILVSFITDNQQFLLMIILLILSLILLFIGAIFVIINMMLSLRAIEMDIKNI